MELQSKRVKDFDRMSAEEKFDYASTWDSFKKLVALTVAKKFEESYDVPAQELDFEADFKELTNNEQDEAAHFVLDVHEALRIKVDEAELEPYDVYDTLFDLVLVLSAEMTDEKLGYVSMFDELEMKFGE